MKIVYTLFSDLVCGGHIVALQHVTRLQKRGHDVSICLLDESVRADRQTYDWFPNFDLDVFHYQDFPKDVDINVATFWGTAISVLQSSAKHKVYFVQLDETKFYTDSVTKSRVALTYLLNMHYMTEAKWIKDWLKNEFGHGAAYIPNGFDSEIIYEVEPLEKKPVGKPRILIEGSINSPFKRVRESLEICQDIDCEIWCVSNNGTPPAHLRVDRFFHKVNFDKMKEIYSSCDILLKLSSVEGMFGPPLEMMACGGVCVVSDVSGYDEYIVDGYNAIVVPGGELALAKKSLEKLTNNPALYAELKKNGLITTQKMSWKNTIDRLEIFFESIYSSASPYEISSDSLELLASVDNHLKELNDLQVFLQASRIWKMRSFGLKISTGLRELLSTFQYLPKKDEL